LNKFKLNQTNDYSINIFKIKSGDVHIPFISKSEPLKNVVLDFYNRIVGENFNKINDKKLALRVVKTMEEINNIIN